MSCNKYAPHVLAIPEDDANRQILNGFHLALPVIAMSRFQVLEEAGGWHEVLNKFKSDQISAMRKFDQRLILLVLDFDDRGQGRMNKVAECIPEDMKNRVFAVGARGEPEDLRKAGLGSFEEIGAKLAEDCRSGSHSIWGHQLLQNNETELARMNERLRPVLFP